MSDTENNVMMVCSKCNKIYSNNKNIWRCSCGGVLNLSNTKLFDLDDLKTRPMNFWRYYEAVGLDNDKNLVGLGEVQTPLLEKECLDRRIQFKLEYLMPTGSYKDRGIAVCMNHVKEIGLMEVSEDSSGNAGASVAAYSAAMDIKANVFVPNYTSKAKVNQIRLFGANVTRIEGNRSDCEKAAQEERDGVYYIGHSWNPYFTAGVKTIAYEIAEQRQWKAPDWVVVPAGGGSLVLGVYYGFKEMYEAGIVERIPQILAIQSENCSPIATAWKEGLDDIASIDMTYTYAEGIALPNPVRGKQVIDAIRKSDGRMETVTETEILNAWKFSAKMGLFIEPTSATAVAGLMKINNQIETDSEIVVILTGNGLKTKSSLMQNED